MLLTDEGVVTDAQDLLLPTIGPAETLITCIRRRGVQTLHVPYDEPTARESGFGPQLGRRGLGTRMAWTFSKRCRDALVAGKLKVTLPRQVRNRILFLLRRYNRPRLISNEYGFSCEATIMDLLPTEIMAELGCSELLAYPDDDSKKPQPSNLEGFILRGAYPSYVFDTLELFCGFLAHPEMAEFQKAFNDIMDESGLPWRMADGKVFPIDSAYIEEEILRRAYALLHETSFHGALEEFEKARADLANGDYQGAIQNASLAVESTIKGILKVDRAKPGELFRKVVERGLVPEYHNGFLKAFEEHILRSVAIIRNEERGVGHGQGATPNDVPPSLAKLAVHLTGVLIAYLVERFIESTAKEREASACDDVAF